MRKHRSKHEIQNEPNQQDQLGLERLIFFSDAVFAIATTLLALEIRLPATQEIATDTQLFERLTGMWHEYLAFFISVMVIGTFWMAHHRKFGFIKHYDNRLVFLNLLLLMVIAFIPFPSAIISKYADRTATIFYALMMALAGLFLTSIWRYAWHHNRFVDPNLNVRVRNREFIAPLTTTTIFLLSIGIAFWGANISRLSWLLILLTSSFTNKN